MQFLSVCQPLPSWSWAALQGRHRISMKRAQAPQFGVAYSGLRNLGKRVVRSLDPNATIIVRKVCHACHSTDFRLADRVARGVLLNLALAYNEQTALHKKVRAALADNEQTALHKKVRAGQGREMKAVIDKINEAQWPIGMPSSSWPTTVPGLRDAWR